VIDEAALYVFDGNDWLDTNLHLGGGGVGSGPGATARAATIGNITIATALNNGARACIHGL
jgi:hypothetical protein